MTDPLPEWARATPNLESLHNLPDIPWGGYNPKDVSLPSLPDLFEFVGKFLEKFLGQVVLALVGTLFPGVSSFEQLQEWAQNLGSQIVNFIYTTSGINLASWDDFVESLADGKGIDLPWLKTGLDALSDLFGGIDFTDPPTPEEVWSAVVSTFINPLINVVEAVANALLTAPLNAANLFGRIALPQFGSGVPIMSLTTAVPNELEPFTATSVPTSDGWSYNAAEDAAQVICDGSLKTLYLRSGVIKVEEGQPLDTSIEVKYSGITSGAGQTIRYVLETFTTDNGSGTPTPVIVGAVTNPSGTITTSVTLGDASWDIPTGVKSVRPALVADESITAGTVYWKNIPELYKKLDPVFAGGLPAVLNNLGDWIETLVDQLLGALGLPALGSLFDKIMDLGDEIEGWFDDTLNTASDLAGLIGDLLSNPASVIGTLTQSMVSGLGDLNTLVNQIRDILAGLVVTPINSTVQAIKDWFSGLTGKTSGLNSSGQMNGTNIIGTIASNVVEGLDDIGDGLQATWNNIWAGLRGAGSASGKSATDVANATAATADLITQVSSIATRLDTSVSQVIRGGGGGTTDQFERVGADLGTDWDVSITGAGSLSTDGNTAKWNPSGGSAASVVAKNITVETATNLQNVSFVLSEPLNATSGWMILGRMNAAKDTYVYMFVKKDYREIGYVTSGSSANVLASSTAAFDPPAGYKVEGHFGLVAFGSVDENYFVLGQPFAGSSLDVTSSAPAKGDAFRGMGFGAKVAAVSGAQVSPGGLELWTGGDAQSPPTVGVYLEAERSSSYQALETSTTMLPANFLSLVRQSDWIAFDAATTTITVELPGAYHVFAAMSLSTVLTSGNDFQMYFGGTTTSMTDMSMRLQPNDGKYVALSTVLYMEAGDSVQLRCIPNGPTAKSAVGCFRVAKLSPPYFA